MSRCHYWGMQDIRKLRVWHEARALSLGVYEATRVLSSRDHPGLAGQLRRASSSVGANIAEGASHDSPREFARYLQLALASAAEVEHHVSAAADVGALDEGAASSLANDSRRLQRMLVLLRRRVLAVPAD